MDLVLEILMNIEDDSFLLFFADLKELDLTGNLLSDWKVCIKIILFRSPILVFIVTS